MSLLQYSTTLSKFHNYSLRNCLLIAMQKPDATHVAGFNAVIDRVTWEKIQQKRGKVRKRKTNDGVKNMFSGILKCADCGHNLWFHFNQGNPDIKYFNCSNYKGNRGTCLSTHYVRVDFLEQVVLGEIRRLTKFASQYEDAFVKAVIGYSQQAGETKRQMKQKELNSMLERDKELDLLFEKDI